MNTENTPLVSVVLEHTGHFLSDSLWALTKQSLKAEHYEVLVCGPLTDKEQKLINDFSGTLKVKSVYLKPGNMRGVLNSVVSIAQGSILLFTDTCSIPDPDLINRHALGHLKESSLFAGFSGQRAWEDKRGTSIFQHSLNHCRHKTIYSHFDHGTILPWDLIRRGNISIKTEMIRKISFPQETFETKYGEDLEFSYLLWLAGVRFTYLSDALVYNLMIPSIEDLIKEEEKAGRDIARLINYYNDATLHLTAMICLSKEALIVWRSKLEPLVDKYHLLLEGIRESRHISLTDEIKNQHQGKIKTSNYALEVLLNLTRTSALIDFALSIPSLRSQDTSVLH